jgi:hypothetical protein
MLLLRLPDSMEKGYFLEMVVLRKIFESRRDEVTGEWRKLHSEKLHHLHSFPNIIRQLKSKRIRWAGHMARMGEE